MCPPTGSPLKSKLMSMYLPKRLELLLRLVRAFPKASSTHVDLSSTSLTLGGAGGAGLEEGADPAPLPAASPHADPGRAGKAAGL